MKTKQLCFLLYLLFLTTFVFSQNIKVFFNQSVDNTISLSTDALTSTHLEDTICKFIDMANKSIEIAVWDNGSAKVVSALNNAYSRGVRVRYISSTNSTNTALSNLNSNIPLLKRNSGLTSNVMHNKFVVVDSLFLLTGSMNFGLGSMENDFNNIIYITDQNLALNYITEFNEMWGSNDAMPNMTNSRFGPAKTDNTLHYFNVDGIPIQSYFSPTDQTTAQIITAIQSANFTLDIAIFTFIHNDLGDAVIAAKNRGVNVRCIIENTSYFGSEYNRLVSTGIAVLSHENIPFDFHHKYCIVDALHGNSNPMVVTGSHNWTNSAEDEYDENTLIIHDSTIACQYLEEFSKRFSEITSVQYIWDTFSFSLHPNPTTGLLNIDLPYEKQTRYCIFNIQGVLLMSGEINSNKLDISSLPLGMYILQFLSVDHQKCITRKIVKE